MDREIGELSAVERDTVQRAQESSYPQWRIAGRDSGGQLVLETVVSGGARRPGKQRRCLLTITTAGLVYSEWLIETPARDAQTSETDRPAGQWAARSPASR